MFLCLRCIQWVQKVISMWAYDLKYIQAEVKIDDLGCKGLDSFKVETDVRHNLTSWGCAQQC